MARDIVLGLSALLFVLITLPPILIPHETLDFDDLATSADALPPSEEIVAFYQRNYAMQQSQTFFHLLGLAAFCVLAGRLAWILRSDPRSAPWSSVAVVSAGAMVAIMAVSMAWVSALLLRNGWLDGREMFTLYQMGWDLHFKANYFAPIFLGAVSLGALRASLLPRWLVWTGFVFAALSLLSTLGNLSRGTFFLQYPVFNLLLAWSLLVAIVAFAGRTRAVVPAARGP